MVGKKKKKSKVVRHKKNTTKKVIRKQENERPVRTWKNWFFILVTIIFIGVVVYLFIFSSLTRINDVQVNGVEKEQKEKITQAINKSLEGKVVNGIMRSNYFFVNKSDIVNSILKNKRIKEVVITKKFPQTINVDITLYDVLPVLCLDDIHGECFILEDGIVKEKINFDSEIIKQNQYFVIVDEGHENVEIGEQIILPEYLEKIKYLGEELKYALSVEIKQPYIILSKGSNEVKFFTDEDWYLLIDTTQDSDEIIDTIKLFFHKADLPSRRTDLEYLDMRFTDKIFYKMKENIEQVEEDNYDELKQKTEETNLKEKKE